MTHERRYARVCLKILLVFFFLFLLLFAGHQKKLLNSHGLNISGSGLEENSHSTAPMNDCSKNGHFKFNALEGHANFQNADTSPPTSKNAQLCQLVLGI